MGKIRYKLKASKFVDTINAGKGSFRLGITVDGYLMVSQDGGNTYDTVFEQEDGDLTSLATACFEVEPWPFDRPDDR